jgi:phenylacetic acid degradation operon negative regulatory protein
VNARSALFDLYGDHLVSRGGRAPVAGIVRCLSALDVAPPAVRTAISRMVKQEWLTAVRTAAGPGYALTPRAVRRVEAAGERIYRTTDRDWDGHWHLVSIERVRERSRRDRLRAGLGYLGYGPLDDTTWLAARPSAELAALLSQETVTAHEFSAVHHGDSAAMVDQVWDLVDLAARYRQWLAAAAEVVAPVTAGASDEDAFAARSRLVHEWRKFLFIDPGLPRELLPAGWPGHEAAQYFDTEASRLAPAASRFVDDCLGLDGRRTT